MKDMDKMATDIENMLREEHVFASAWPYMDLPVVQVEIEWGDWKHEHLRADWLVKEKFGGVLIGTRVTEDDGSDCYSAIRNYAFC